IRDFHVTGVRRVLFRSQIKGLVMRVLAEAGPVQITAITATSQREGIVVLDNEGSPIIGMSNHDNRGREWESMVAAKDLVCTLTEIGRASCREREGRWGM